MLYQNRDRGISRIQAREDKRCYGMGLGIMILDEVYPGFPGDVRNASAYPFPIQYDIVKDVDIPRLVFEDDKSPCLEPILESAMRLQDMGCRAIAAECGYFAFFQREVAAQLDIPVFMSSLLQVPLMQITAGLDHKVGLLCALKNLLTDTHLQSVGIQPSDNIVIAGAMDEYHLPEFDSLWITGKRPVVPTSNFEKAEKDFVAVCKDFVHKNPGMKALTFECTGFQPFARAAQREIDIPIYSWSTLLDYAYSVVVHREHYGHV